MLVVDKWGRVSAVGADDCSRQSHDWIFAALFELNEYEKATMFAMELSRSKTPKTLAVFDEGQQTEAAEDEST
jgi:hypothetical protein